MVVLGKKQTLFQEQINEKNAFEVRFFTTFRYEFLQHSFTIA